ncbi:MAG: hypothetical protein LUD72_12085 [Bacteroidales bacterium]|nr:hypothetical protein [Bacteroidales bacterium]
MMLDEIKAALEQGFDIPIYYGTSAEASGQAIYDYIVFWRESMDWKVNSKGDYTEHYKVALVRQNFIPEDEQTKVIDTLRGIPGLKETGNVAFDYMTMPGTALAMEVAEYEFIAARKRLDGGSI